MEGKPTTKGRPGQDEGEIAIHAAYDELWGIDKLKPNPQNPNKHPQKQIERLSKIIRSQGWRAPITVSTRSGFIVRGHARLEAARLLECKQVPVDLQDYNSDAMELADLIADNRIAELAEMDMSGLKDILEELDTGALDMEITGFDLKEIEDLMTQFHISEEGLTPDDEIPEKVETICKTGDLWQLSGHRLLCGDSTKKEDVERLMGGEKANCMWTDPPYGVKYVGKTEDALTIENDDRGGLLKLLNDAFCNAEMFCVESGHWYIAHPPGVLSLTFGDVIRQLEWRLHETLVWVKDSMVLGHTDYHYRHEPIFYGYFPGECIECGKIFEQMRRLKGICSECRKIRRLRFRPQTYKICVMCGMRFGPVVHLARKFCSQKCKVNYLQGEHHPRWQGGKSSETARVRAKSAYIEWRNEVFKRDDYTCQDCLRRSKKGERIEINAHHIKSLSKNGDGKYKLENGITLCIDCHRRHTAWQRIARFQNFTGKKAVKLG